MKYNAILFRKYQSEPVKTIMELEIPEHLDNDDVERLWFAAKELMDDFRIELEEIENYNE